MCKADNIEPRNTYSEKTFNRREIRVELLKPAKSLGLDKSDTVVPIVVLCMVTTPTED